MIHNIDDRDAVVNIKSADTVNIVDAQAVNLGGFMTHDIRERCELPKRKWRWKVGSVYACNCGKMYRLSHEWTGAYGSKLWRRIDSCAARGGEQA